MLPLSLSIKIHSSSWWKGYAPNLPWKKQYQISLMNCIRKSYTYRTNSSIFNKVRHVRQLLEDSSALVAAQEPKLDATPLSHVTYPLFVPQAHERCSHYVRPPFKTKVPLFVESDPPGWIFKTSQVFNFHNSVDEQQIQIAWICLDSLALSWHQWMF